MSASEEFYTAERWNNWIDRVRETDLDPEDEDSARLLLNLQDDTAIAVAKILRAVQREDPDEEQVALDEETALSELANIREVVLDEVDLEDEEKRMLVDGVQTSLVCVLAAAEEYIAGEPPEDGTPAEYVEAAAEAEADDPDAALGYCVHAGTLIIDGQTLDMSIAEDIEYGLVSEWLNGLDSLQSALSDPEVIDEE
jgi:hypothetical protein